MFQSFDITINHGPLLKCTKRCFRMMAIHEYDLLSTTAKSCQF